MSQLPLIKMFWYGSRLPVLQQMCIASFVKQGHPVDLYSYENQLEGLPRGVQLCDASEILPRESVFQESRGSYALFADQFRYQLLHQLGGWWVDCDVYCVRPFEFDAEHVFGLEWPEKINNAVIKAPSGGRLTERLIQDAEQLAVHRQWDQAVQVFHNAVVACGLQQAALPQHVFYPVPYQDWDSFFKPGGLAVPDSAYAVHLWAEMHRRQNGAKQPYINRDSPAYTMWRETLDHTQAFSELAPDFTLYVLSYNCPKQFEYWIQRCGYMYRSAARRVLIDNTNQPHLSLKYEQLCDKYGFEHIKLDNPGIMGGRIAAADHFVRQADSDFCIFCEDDHLLGVSTEDRCRSGYPTHIDSWLEKSLCLARHERLDYLKLLFSEVFFDNDVQVSWHNVSEADRARLFPGSTEPPPTRFTDEKEFCGLEYLLGEVFWCTWPSIMSKQGSLPLLRPDFQGQHDTYAMGEIYKLTVEGKYKPAVLKATLGYHHREYDYNRETRKL
ncbi:MAG: hypothetical protein AAGI37_09235 [Planctomycetota bacterium]